MVNSPSNSIHPKTRSEWHQWLEQNHTQCEGIWVISFKKATGQARLEYDEAVEEALCFGWVDSKPNKLDDERSILWFAPPKSGTGWSRHNKNRVAKLIEAGEMSPAGLVKIEAAKQDGSWNALDAIEKLEIPPDLAKEFAENPTASEYFEAFPRSAKRAILEWIANAKQPATRATRIEETVRLAAKNVRANQWRK